MRRKKTFATTRINAVTTLRMWIGLHPGDSFCLAEAPPARAPQIQITPPITIANGTTMTPSARELRSEIQPIRGGDGTAPKTGLTKIASPAALAPAARA